MGRGNTGAIIALVFFVITSGLFGWLFYTQYDRVERLDHPEKGKGLRGQLQDARNLLAGEKKKLEDARTELAARKKALRAEFDRKLRAEVTVNLEEVKQTHALHAKGTAVGIKAKIPGTNEFAISESKKAVGNYHTRKDDSQKRNDTQIQDLTKKRQKLIKDIEDFKNKVATEKDELTGERNNLTDKVVPHDEMFETKRIDTQNVEFEVQLPPTTIEKKYDLFITILRKNRRY